MEQELEQELTTPKPPPVIDDADEAPSEEDLLSHEQRFQRWQSKRPPIDHLRDALHVDHQTGDIVPLFDVGDRIVVDRRTTLLKGVPWLETIVGKVRSIDDDTGLVTVYDEDSDPRNPPVRYTSFKDGLHTFKLAPERGNPFEPPPPPKKEKPQPVPGKKGRGRPKGSKNRPKDVIKAEREARKAAKGNNK
jgi:hypothetical protein